MLVRTTSFFPITFTTTTSDFSIEIPCLRMHHNPPKPSTLTVFRGKYTMSRSKCFDAPSASLALAISPDLAQCQDSTRTREAGYCEIALVST